MVLLYEPLGTLALNDISGMRATERLRAHERSSKPRVLSRLGFSGSTSSGDSKIEILAGEYVIAQAYNFNTSGQIQEDDMMPVFGLIPAKVPIIIKVTDAFEDDCWIAMLLEEQPSTQQRRFARSRY